MIKVIGLLSRKEGLTHEQFVQHWVGIHGPMAQGMPELRRYIQSQVRAEPTRPDIPQLIGEGEVDGIAELWFDDRAAHQRYGASPEAKRWQADGALFIGRIKSFVVEEDVVLP